MENIVFRKRVNRTIYDTFYKQITQKTPKTPKNGILGDFPIFQKRALSTFIDYLYSRRFTMSEKSTLRVNAVYNGNKFSTTFEGDDAERIVEILTNALLGKSDKSSITDYA